jgi:syntaxin-binding protein 5
MIMQARADEQQRRAESRTAGVASGSSAAGQDEGYWAYMQRQLNERTEKLGIMGDSMDKLESNSAGWADEVGKFVQKQKRNLVMGGKFNLNEKYFG